MVDGVSSPSSAHRIRSAVADDHAAVLDLAVSFYREEGFTTAAPVLSAHLSALIPAVGARVAVAVMCGYCVGFCITTTKFGLEQGHIAELEDLYVLPEWRRHGIAGALIDDSARWASELGCGELELVIVSHGHNATDLRDYYLRRGFTDTGRILIGRRLSDPAQGPA
jgi:aminoglycoside 6'-N-acetyltransferase I